MSIIVNKTNGNIVAVVEDGTVDTISTSISLVGKGVTSYGEYIAENSVRMLENFADLTPPAHPIVGQLWFNTSSSQLNTFDGSSWVIPVPQTFYSTSTDSTGTGSITVSNNSGITVGSSSTAQLAVESGYVVLKTNSVNNAFSINPSDGLVTVKADPVANLGVATKQYVDNLEFIGNGAEDRLTVTTNSIELLLGNETVVSGNSDGITLNGVSRTSNTPAVATNDTQIANTAFVQLNKVSPEFTGTPTAPTATTLTNTTQIATTAFVQNNKVSPAFTGTPTAPTATVSTNSTQIATTEFVQNQLVADKISTAFSGTPTTPTASAGTNTTQIASTAFVTNAVETLSSAANTTYAPKASPALTGIPTAPTAAVGNSTTQIATTSYVMTATEKWAGSRKFVSTSDPVSGQGSDGDFWFKII